MLYLVTGGSGSGKSEYAERIAVRCHGKRTGGLYYIATMHASSDAECQQRIARHRTMRRGKGFKTVECPVNIGSISADAADVLLLECMSNLLANEMFLEEGRMKSKGAELVMQMEDLIVTPLFALKDNAGDVIAVTNEVFSDGAVYDDGTKRYVEMLAGVNRRLAGEADVVTEVVCGIPLALKGELPC